VGCRPVTLAQPTRKEAIWLACKEKACCYASVVIPTGQDIWRIARTLDTPPWSFLIYFHSPQPRRDAFHLDHSGRQFRVALAKGKTRRKKTPAPCIFLLRTRDGSHRCGLGDLRPGVCRTFPSEVVEGVVCTRPDSGCACREWTLLDVDVAEELEALAERQEDVDAYCGVVSAWNAQVAAAPTNTSFDFLEFCEFVLAAYDRFVLASNLDQNAAPAGPPEPYESARN
jgi:Fe-S-cluster containining protein